MDGKTRKRKLEGTRIVDEERKREEEREGERIEWDKLEVEGRRKGAEKGGGERR